MGRLGPGSLTDQRSKGIRGNRSSWCEQPHYTPFVWGCFSRLSFLADRQVVVVGSGRLKGKTGGVRVYRGGNALIAMQGL